MDIETAKTAGDLAAYINPRLEMITKLDQMIAEGWIICGVQAKDASGGNAIGLIKDDLDTETSALVLTYAKQIYQSQIDPAQAQLTAL